MNFSEYIKKSCFDLPGRENAEQLLSVGCFARHPILASAEAQLYQDVNCLSRG